MPNLVKEFRVEVGFLWGGGGGGGQKLELKITPWEIGFNYFCWSFLCAKGFQKAASGIGR